MLGFLRLEGELAPVEVRHERPVPGRRELVGDPLDLIVQAPPFLNHDDAGCHGAAGRFGQVSFHDLPVRAGVFNHRSHRLTP